MTTPNLNWALLYADDVRKSVAFYTRLLGRGPAEISDNFAMYPLESGLMLGLWNRRDVEPTATAVGGSELSFTEPDADAVRARHAEWRDAGVTIIQAPTSMDFGTTFTAIDPDGHRLRVFAAPAA